MVISQSTILDPPKEKSGSASNSLPSKPRNNKPKNKKNSIKSPKEKSVSIINDNNMKKKGFTRQSKPNSRSSSEASKSNRAKAFKIPNMSECLKGIIVNLDNQPFPNYELNKDNYGFC